MSDQQQMLRLLATIREEVSEIRSRQEELFEILSSYKDQIYELKTTVVDGLAGLPKSPYIAGQLVPAPDRLDGVDKFEELISTFLHRNPSLEEAGDAPRDVEFTPPPEVKPEDIKLEPRDDKPRRRGPGGGGRRPHRDTDLERGPDRDIEPLDLDGPIKSKKDSKGRGRGRSRGRSRKKGGSGGGKGDKKGDKAEKKPAAEAAED